MKREPWQEHHVGRRSAPPDHGRRSAACGSRTQRDTPVGQSDKDGPAEVAEQGFEAMLAGKNRVVAESLRTKAQELANKVLPDQLKAAVHRKMAEPNGDR
ncbi:hypothetical protein [Kribbella endophytica]